MKNLAPIVLFVYNRPWHTGQMLKSLSENNLADKSVLYIYADGAKQNASREQLDKIEQVRNLIKSKQWCSEVHIVESDINKGLANSVISGVTKIVNQHGKVIVLEDDIVTSKGFLKYMNDALYLYEGEEKVAGVSGYNYRISSKDSTFFLRQGSSWGWGTWKRVWDAINFDIDLVKYFDNQNIIKKFNVNNSYGFYQMLLDQKVGKIDSWAIRFYASFFLAEQLFLHPRFAMSDSIGIDEGTHVRPGEKRVNLEKLRLLQELKIKREKIFVKRKNERAIEKHLKSLNDRVGIHRIVRTGIKKGIKNIIKLSGYSISKQPKHSDVLENVFNSSCQKRVLISYVLEPFIHGIKKSHTNYMECYTIAETFHELGFCVDVIDFMDKRNIDYNRYDIICGFGYPLEKAFYSGCAEKIKKILYSTGASPFYSNKNTALKILKFQKKTEKMIPQSGRLLCDFWTLQIVMPDLNICLGNQYVANTFLDINSNLNIQTLPIFYYDVYDIDLSKKSKESKKHFLWFGSSGLLHKGLDILIDIFFERDDIFLHICGASKTEKIFFDYYQPIINKSNNIIEHGFVDIESDNFRDLMHECAFVVFPSVSEGGAAAIVNVMANGGLIPIVSISSGLDVEEDGYVFENIEKNEILNKINEALKLTEDELYSKMLKIKSNIRSDYSHQKYKVNLQNILSTYLEELSQ